jgi:hypothetical protein
MKYRIVIETKANGGQRFFTEHCVQSVWFWGLVVRENWYALARLDKGSSYPRIEYFNHIEDAKVRIDLAIKTQREANGERVISRTYQEYP